MKVLVHGGSLAPDTLTELIRGLSGHKGLSIYNATHEHDGSPQSLAALTKPAPRESDGRAPIPAWAVLVVCASHSEGPGFVRNVRQLGADVPLVLLVDPGEVGFASSGKRAQALNAGADYCFSFPVSCEELAAALKAVVRRKYGVVGEAVEFADGEFVFDPSADRVYVKESGEDIKLTTHEFRLLQLLLLRQGTTVTREMALVHLYAGRDDEPELKILDVFISKLRKKLVAHSKDKEKKIIETIWGRGWIIGGSGDRTRPADHLPALLPQAQPVAAAV